MTDSLQRTSPVTEALKPCPFCGVGPQIFRGTGYVTVGCDYDGCSINPSVDAPLGDEAESLVVKAWNTRGLAQTPAVIDQEKFCIAYAWAYGTELEREHYGSEPNDGMTPETLWAQGSEEERDFMRRIVRNTFAALSHSSTDRGGK